MSSLAEQEDRLRKLYADLKSAGERMSAVNGIAIRYAAVTPAGLSAAEMAALRASAERGLRARDAVESRWDGVAAAIAALDVALVAYEHAAADTATLLETADSGAKKGPQS